MSRQHDQLKALLHLRAELVCSLNSLNHHAPLHSGRGGLNLRIAAEHIGQAIGELSNRIEELNKVGLRVT